MSTVLEAGPLRLHCMLAGRDVATRHPVAGQLRNQLYMVEDVASKQALLVDPCWDVAELLDLVTSRGLELAGVLLTHAHPDHVGGDLFGLDIEGLQRLLELAPVPVWMNQDELPVLAAITGLGPHDFDLHTTVDGSEIPFGASSIRCLHTPGHSPGGQVFLLPGKRAIVGDTLFVGAIGRLDLPGADPLAMWGSLEKLKQLPAETTVHPGHDYGRAPSSTIGEELRSNPYLQFPTQDAWRRAIGG